MEINRADRFERELELMTAQNRDLQRENAQLKASMQVSPCYMILWFTVTHFTVQVRPTAALQPLHTAQCRHHHQQPASQHEPHNHQLVYDQEQLYRRQQRQQLAFSPVEREHRMHGQLPHQQSCHARPTYANLPLPFNPSSTISFIE